MTSQFSRGPGRRQKRTVKSSSIRLVSHPAPIPPSPHQNITVRLMWLLMPLLTVALISAPEWPARAAMWASGDSWAEDALVHVAEGWSDIVVGPAPGANIRPVVSPSVPRPALSSAPALPAAPTTMPLAPSVLISPVPAIPSPSPTAALSVAPIAPATLGPEAVAIASTTPPPPAAPPAALEVPPTTHVSAARVLLIGDSLMGGVAPGMRQGLPSSFVLNNQYKVSTGLTNEQYFNWPAEAFTLVSNDQPDWVVIHIGANDPYSMRANGHWIKFGTPEWDAAYALRAQELIHSIREAHPQTHIVWLGMPAMRSSALNDKLAVITAIQRSVAATEGVPFIDGHAALGASYQKEGAMPDGRRRVWRANDGIHYSPAAGRMLSRAVAQNPDINWAWSDG